MGKQLPNRFLLHPLKKTGFAAPLLLWEFPWEESGDYFAYDLVATAFFVINIITCTLNKELRLFFTMLRQFLFIVPHQPPSLISDLELPAKHVQRH